VVSPRSGRILTRMLLSGEPHRNLAVDLDPPHPSAKISQWTHQFRPLSPRVQTGQTSWVLDLRPSRDVLSNPSGGPSAGSAGSSCISQSSACDSCHLRPVAIDVGCVAILIEEIPPAHQLTGEIHAFRVYPGIEDGDDDVFPCAVVPRERRVYLREAPLLGVEFVVRNEFGRGKEEIGLGKLDFFALG